MVLYSLGWIAGSFCKGTWVGSLDLGKFSSCRSETSTWSACPALTVQVAETLASSLPALCPLASPVPTDSERASGIRHHGLPFLSSNLLGSTSRVLGTAHGPQLSDHPLRHPQCPGRPPLRHPQSSNQASQTDLSLPGVL